MKLWTALTPRAMFKLREVVEALRVWKPGQKLRIIPSQIINKEAVITVVMDEYDGRKNAKIEKVTALEGGGDGGVEANAPGPEDDDIPF